MVHHTLALWVGGGVDGRKVGGWVGDGSEVSGVGDGGVDGWVVVGWVERVGCCMGWVGLVVRLGWYFDFLRSTDKIQFFDEISSSGKICRFHEGPKI